MRNNENHLIEIEIAKYVDAFRAGVESEVDSKIIEHLEECSICKKNVLEILDIVDEVTANGNMPSMQKHTTYAYLKYAAAILIILIPTYFLVNLNTERKNSTPIKSTKEVVEKPAIKLDKLIVEVPNKEDLYKEISEYEAICGDSFRSISVNIISPQNGIISEGEIYFNIKFSSESNRFIKIFNNKDILVESIQVDQNIFKAERKFRLGLYYWKIETENEIEYLGKFIIRN